MKNILLLSEAITIFRNLAGVCFLPQLPGGLLRVPAPGSYARGCRKSPLEELHHMGLPIKHSLVQLEGLEWRDKRHGCQHRLLQNLVGIKVKSCATITVAVRVLIVLMSPRAAPSQPGAWVCREDD